METGILLTRSAPGKVILFGEHAVVYGRPALAVPVSQVRATATVEPSPPGSGLTIVAPQVGKHLSLSLAPQDEPLGLAARLTLERLCAREPDATLTISSTIPMAGGMGSGAAVSAALIRALAGFLGCELDSAQLSELVFEVEKIHHGTPSGIDNTVIAYEQPIYFVRGHPVQRLNVGAPFTLLIGDTGVSSPTREAVAQVRRAREEHPARYETLFDRIGAVAARARDAIEAGDIHTLGLLMDENQALLVEIGVSSPELDVLVRAARLAGALGAKLSGAGRGGNMVALVEENTAIAVEEALSAAGAARVIRTSVVPRAAHE
ncbi:MAG: mevalonate kinase [Anaerolineae bacterium]|nr:mevalonate kinase [Anaerolineae bacterium]